MANELSFEGRVVAITGAGNGLGRAYAHELAKRGASIVVNDLGTAGDGTGSSQSAAEQVVSEVAALGGRAVPNFESVATPEGGQSIVDLAVKTFGRIDALVSNAGILRDRAFHKLERADLDKVLDVHLRGSFFTTQAAFRAMKDQGQGGRIVVTSSAVALFGNFGQANYVAAKLGIVGLASSLAIEGARSNILANCVAPMASTRLTRKEFVEDANDPRAPHRVAPLVAYLCHQACSTSGHIYVAGNNYFARAAMLLGAGWAAQPDELTAEAVAAHWSEVDSLTDARELKTGYDIVEILNEKVPYLRG